MLQIVKPMVVGMLIMSWGCVWATMFPHTATREGKPKQYAIRFKPTRVTPVCKQLPARLVVQQKDAYQPDRQTSHVVTRIKWKMLRISHETFHFNGTMTARLLRDGKVRRSTLVYQGVGVESSNQLHGVFTMPGCQGFMNITMKY